MRARWLGLGLIVVLIWTSCGDEAAEDTFDPTKQCGVDFRLSAVGEVGATDVSMRIEEPYEGVAGDTYFDVVLESGDNPHVIVFSSNVALDRPLREALRERLDSGAANAGTLNVATRPNDTPCDPREGVICARFGVDTNNDGILFGAGEIIYPTTSGTATFTEVSGNELTGTFDITFGPLESGEETRGETGGSMAGCFRYYLSADHGTLY